MRKWTDKFVFIVNTKPLNIEYIFILCTIVIVCPILSFLSYEIRRKWHLLHHFIFNLSSDTIQFLNMIFGISLIVLLFCFSTVTIRLPLFFLSNFFFYEMVRSSPVLFSSSAFLVNLFNFCLSFYYLSLNWHSC